MDYLPAVFYIHFLKKGKKKYEQCLDLSIVTIDKGLTIIWGCVRLALRL